MCGRFALYSEKEEIKEVFNLDDIPIFPKLYNIAPTQQVLCIKDNKGHREASLMHWGLIPFWASDKKISRNLVNARADSVAVKPAFRNAFKTHRGLLVMSGFYEWKRVGDVKQPYYFKHADDSPLAVAAIWETWRDKDHGNEEIQSCCLITTGANDAMRPIHDRMPVILSTEQQNIWLNHTDVKKEELQSVLKPCPAGELTKYPVSSKMNNARFEDDKAIEPISD